MTEILDLSFEVVRRFRPFSLLAPGFEVDVTSGSPEQGGLVHASTGPPAPYATVSAGLATASEPVALGLAAGPDDHVLVRWSPDTSRITLELQRSGRTRVLRRRKLTLSGPCDVAFVLCENQVTALVDAGAGWRPVLTERAKIAEALDLRQEHVLRRYRYAWARPHQGSAVIRAGLFGHAGLRDPHLVQNADGTPYTRNGRHFLTWTSAGLGWLRQAHWSVWSFLPEAPDEMRLEAKLFAERRGCVLGDHAGQIVRDGDQWHVLVSSWGDFPDAPIHVRHVTTREDPLAGVHVLRTEPTMLPTSDDTWDPGLSRVDGAWNVSFVESRSQTPFHFRPLLARTSAEQWTSGLEAVPLEGDFRQCEGPILVSVNGRRWVIATDGVSRTYPVFTLTGTRVGRLAAPYLTNLPHPQILPDPRGGWFLVTFDGTQFWPRVMGYGGHGDVVVMHTV